ncbi:MAG: hypothetical protein O3C20_23605 [Verrucomicrobia bacterium]|nr:hypothetical protein [Verrucomicrobiota bacterium]
MKLLFRLGSFFAFNHRRSVSNVTLAETMHEKRKKLFRFIGVSKGNLLTAEDVCTMAVDAIIR